MQKYVFGKFWVKNSAVHLFCVSRHALLKLVNQCGFPTTGRRDRPNSQDHGLELGIFVVVIG